jgi:hypothetical protein
MSPLLLLIFTLLLTLRPVSPDPNLLRKELVKARILSRLGLSTKPRLDLPHRISPELVLRTLQRTQELTANDPAAEGLPGQFPSLTHLNRNRTENESTHQTPTSQIISFPEKGKKRTPHG